MVSGYALRGVSQPIGVTEGQLTPVPPPELRRSLPSSNKREAGLGAAPTAELQQTPPAEE